MLEVKNSNNVVIAGPSVVNYVEYARGTITNPSRNNPLVNILTPTQALHAMVFIRPPTVGFCGASLGVSVYKDIGIPIFPELISEDAYGPVEGAISAIDYVVYLPQSMAPELTPENIVIKDTSGDIVFNGSNSYLNVVHSYQVPAPPNLSTITSNTFTVSPSADGEIFVCLNNLTTFLRSASYSNATGAIIYWYGLMITDLGSDVYRLSTKRQKYKYFGSSQKVSDSADIINYPLHVLFAEVYW